MLERRINPVGRAATASVPRITLGGLRLAVLDIEQTANFMVDMVFPQRRLSRPLYLTSANGEVLARCSTEPMTERLFRAADLINADGQPLVTVSRLKSKPPLPQRVAIGTVADPVLLEIFNNLFMSIAEQMGVSLQNTAYSVNIKERLDFSCAVFDGTGALVANAPHMPVHLGSMDRAVETIIRENKGRIAPGDVYVINAPYNGGTHLPESAWIGEEPHHLLDDPGRCEVSICYQHRAPGLHQRTGVERLLPVTVR